MIDLVYLINLYDFRRVCRMVIGERQVCKVQQVQVCKKVWQQKFLQGDFSSQFYKNNRNLYNLWQEYPNILYHNAWVCAINWLQIHLYVPNYENLTFLLQFFLDLNISHPENIPMRCFYEASCDVMWEKLWCSTSSEM